MKGFLKPTIVILTVIATLLLGVVIFASSNDSYSPMISQGINSVLSPVQSFFSGISNSVSTFFDSFINAGQIAEENKYLIEENNRLENELIELENTRRQNEMYEEMLGIVEINPDLALTPAFVIGRDPADSFGAFSIDKGAVNDIEKGDPVITSEGVVGIITEVSSHTSKVMTILDISFNMGAVCMETSETGIISGDAALYPNGQSKLSYITPQSEIKEGDLLLSTQVGGVFPSDLVIGTVVSVASEVDGISNTAIIEPAVDPRVVKEVFVITSHGTDTL